MFDDIGIIISRLKRRACMRGKKAVFQFDKRENFVVFKRINVHLRLILAEVNFIKCMQLCVSLMGLLNKKY